MENNNTNARNVKKTSPSSSYTTSPKSSIVDEIFGRSDSSKAVDVDGGYFSSVFPPASTMMGKDLSHSDVCWKQRNEESKYHSNSNRRQVTYNKDGKPVYYNEPSDSSYFGSSVHYGGRDFYSSSSSKQTSENSKTYKPDDNDANAATRGDWWQGSLYY